MEEATRSHFFYHGKPGREDEKASCHWCQIRSFETHKEFPITVINEEDDSILGPDFRFIQDFILGRGVQAADASFRSGCECSKDEQCQFRGCHCLAEVDDDNSDNDGRPNRKVQLYAYHTRGAKAGIMRSKILESERRSPIYECHAACSCSKNCPNRVVERGRQVPLQIFRTKDRGWGVRSTVDIRKGQFVDRYVGEVITAQEADHRRQLSQRTQKKDVYLFALDKFYDPDSLDERLSAPPLLVDGEFMSGPTRFINHSCDPNLRIFARVGDHADKHIHDLALFALRDIPKWTELTFDYVDGVEDGEDDVKDPEKLKDMTKCLCRSENCRGFLW